jgi:hypothetical protein
MNFKKAKMKNNIIKIKKYVSKSKIFWKEVKENYKKISSIL